MKKTKCFLIVGFLVGLISFKSYSQTAGCSAPSSSTYLDINNVRALIMNSSDMWWDLQGSPLYEIPKGSGKNSLFAGSLWIGGLDQNGQLHFAGQRFRQDGIDFWSGPLSVSGANQSETDQEHCMEYDKLFKIYKDEVKQFRNWYNTPFAQRDSLYPGYTVPSSIIDWPANGDVANNYSNYLAPFFDNDNDGFYNPEFGDYPYFDLDGAVNCVDNQWNNVSILYGDVSIWWVFNDKGDIHTETGGDAFGIEVKAQAFAYQSNDDDINNSTFYKYEIFNRSTDTYSNTYVGVFTDPDIGYANDDFVGCDVSRGLGYVYNGTSVDGSGQSSAYGICPPAVGIDFIRGPYKDTDGLDDLSNWDNSGVLDCNNGYRINNATGLKEIAGPSDINNGNINGLNYGDGIIDNERWGMRRFIYFNNATGPSATQDPNTATHHYNYLLGKWRDNSNLLYGGIGWGTTNPTQISADFMFPELSDKCNWGTNGTDMLGLYPNGWSESESGNQPGDRRFVQSAGPLTLEPGEVNDIMIAAVWARSIVNNIVSLEDLKLADDKIQKIFDNCMHFLDFPKNPELNLTVSSNQINFNIWNQPYSNNYNESYSQIDYTIDCPSSNPSCDKSYNFQGYKVFQLKNNSIAIDQLNDTSKAKLVYQCDIADSIIQIINYYWNYDSLKYIPQIQVVGANQGINHNFSLTHNAFSATNQLFENFKNYYFIAVAYAYNNYKQFNLNGADSLTGQRLQYIQGNNINIYSAMPAPANTTTDPNYGNQPELTQYDGFGCGYNILDLNDETLSKIMSGAPWKADTIKYNSGSGPIKIKVVDPLNVPFGEYEIKMLSESVRKNSFGYFYYNPYFYSDTLNYDIYGYITDAVWVIKDKDGVVNPNPIGSIYSTSWISVDDYKIISELGLSVEIVQTPYSLPAESFPNQPEITKQSPENNGFLATSIEYSDPAMPWLKFMPDEDVHDFRDWIKSGTDYTDPSSNDCNWYYNDKTSSTAITEHWLDVNEKFEKNLDANFVPYRLVSYYNHEPGELSSLSQIKSKDQRLANVDLIITSDTSKWTRCPVLETTDNQYKSDADGCTIQESNIGNTTAEDYQKKLYMRTAPSVGKDGLPDYSGIGMGWFPGYAIDVETGERLNMMFGESSRLTGDNGRDMLWNPSARTATDLYWSTNGASGEPIMGGKHFVYIMGHNIKYSSSSHTYTESMKAYDNGTTLETLLNGSAIDRKNALMNCMWVGIPLQDTLYDYMACDVRIKLRVVSPYRRKIWDYNTVKDTLGPNKGFPMYSFVTDGLVNAGKVNNINDEQKVLIYPNPSTGNFILKIDSAIRLNAKFDIYSLDGRIVKSGYINSSLQDFNIAEKGIYVVKISNGYKVWSQKVVVL